MKVQRRDGLFEDRDLRSMAEAEGINILYMIEPAPYAAAIDPFAAQGICMCDQDFFRIYSSVAMNPTSPLRLSEAPEYVQYVAKCTECNKEHIL